jgi:hypothetical protein
LILLLYRAPLTFDYLETPISGDFFGVSYLTKGGEGVGTPKGALSSLVFVPVLKVFDTVITDSSIDFYLWRWKVARTTV